jgi:hypothetical protein
MRRSVNSPTAAGYRATPTESPPIPTAALPSGRNTRIDIGWGRGIEGQGRPWEEEITSQLPPGATPLPRAETWDHFVEEHGLAISAKTMDTTTYTYASKPAKIYAKLSGYIDEAASYGARPIRRRLAVPPEKITSKEIHLAIPDSTSGEQWSHIYRAILYGRTRGVRLVVTRIGDPAHTAECRPILDSQNQAGLVLRNAVEPISKFGLRNAPTAQQ